MFDHISIGVRDIEKARAFYDATLATLGLSCLRSSADTLGYGREAVQLWVGVSARPVPADPASGLHLCLTAPSRVAVDAFHAAALGHGGQDNGKPGLRSDYGPHYYAAFVVDPDGYRLEAYHGSAPD
jgi:catechol 2,3-dioxygenase-like lactoylglutathione lyase family enzyme